jgi:HAD superfamily hydrolase (TIGR01509 family)
MPKFTDFAAVIFDMDDTLMSNHPPSFPFGLHEESRRLASQVISERYDVPELALRPPEYHLQVFRNAAEHSLEGAIWQTLLDHNLVEGEIDRSHPLLREFVDLKEDLHGDIMRREGLEVPGAAAFVRLLAEHGFADKMAIASTAYRRDVFICLEKLDIEEFFPPERIISKDMFTHAKPHPESFQMALASLKLPKNVKPAQVLAFEDDPRGVASAKATGLFTCAITSRFSKKEFAALEVTPDLVADSYAEFAQLFGLPG